MNATATNPDISTETKSIGSTRSRGSAVLARAREYNRIIDENRSRSKSRDGNRNHNHIPSPPRDARSSSAPRSTKHVSVSQMSQMSQRERAMASVQASTVQPNVSGHGGTSTGTGTSTGGGYHRRVDSNSGVNGAGANANANANDSSNSRRKDRHTSNSNMNGNSNSSSGHNNFEQSNNFQQQHQYQHHHHHQQQQQYRSSPTPSQKSAAKVKDRGSTKTMRPSPQSQPQYQYQSQSQSAATNKENNYRDRETQRSSSRSNGVHHRDSNSNSNVQRSGRSDSNRNSLHEQQQAQQQQQQQQQPNQAIVTPELLVDALSGHEDGLLAIAERLMEHYDSGYDAMGEAIIDAFADVQKLFQHVVEAAHMEGAAYEAGRREEEIERLKRALGGEGGGAALDYSNEYPKSGGDDVPQNNNNASSSPLRHEEFVDQDVRDVLVEAIRKGQSLKDSSKFAECYQLYEHACNSASALLPVDSDHRGRLQLSIARAESMNAERACAILKYVMDDVLRSGLTSNSKVVMPDPSQRGDCVLSRPPPKSRIMDDSSLNSKYNGTAVAGGDGVVLQSSEEALASMVEEMKEILAAPVYDNSPLQSVAERFWTALNEAQRNNMKTEEKLEQKLGELKGDFLLARMEWEEKYNTLSRELENQKRKAERLRNARYMDQARQGVSSIGKDSDNEKYLDNESHHASNYDSPRSGRPSSVASFASLSHHAKSIVSTFSCTGEREFAEQKKSGNRINPRRNVDRSPPPATTTHRSPQYNSRR